MLGTSVHKVSWSYITDHIVAIATCNLLCIVCDLEEHSIACCLLGRRQNESGLLLHASGESRGSKRRMLPITSVCSS